MFLFEKQTFAHPLPPLEQDQDLPGGLSLGRKWLSLQDI